MKPQWNKTYQIQTFHFIPVLVDKQLLGPVDVDEHRDDVRGLVASLAPAAVSPGFVPDGVHGVGVPGGPLDLLGVGKFDAAVLESFN